MQKSPPEWKLGRNGEVVIMISKQELAVLLCKQAGITRKCVTRPELTKEEMYKLHAYMITKCKR